MVCRRISKAQTHDRARIDHFPRAVATVKAGTKVHTDKPPPVFRNEPRTSVEDNSDLCWATAERVTEELAAIAFSDMGDVFGVDGRILPLAEIPAQVRRAIASYTVRQRTRTQTGRGGKKVVESVEVVSVRLHSKVAALAALARYLRLFRHTPVIRIGRVA